MAGARTLFEPEAKPWTPPRHGYVRVAVERGIDRGWSRGDAEGLTYATDEPLAVGDPVQVPLGRGNTPTHAIVIATGGTELLGSLDPQATKRAVRAKGDGLSPALVELGVWMSAYYVCPLGMTFASMAPASVKRGVGKRTIRLLVRTGEAQGDTKLSPLARDALEKIEAMDASAFPIAERALASEVGAPNAGPIRKLVRAGLLREIERETVRAREIAGATDTGEDVPPALSEDQTRAMEGIGAGLGSFGVHVLHGVTGSGKTEVYLRVVERALELGKSAIILAPEIALTPQTLGRFVRRFGGPRVAVLHSGLTGAQRTGAWARAASGEARVVVGARSAVFAPVRELGVIVVDEEHDASYKQDRAPRYHARDVAIKRAQVEGALALLGSATPSLETWANATTKDSKWSLWRMPKRVRGSMPQVRIVDLRDERRAAAEAGDRADALVGPTMSEALRTTIADGGQAIVLLNRRGYASVVCCADRRCGWRLGCEHCDVSLVWHRAGRLPRGGLVRCHHCLAERVLPGACPSCGGAVKPVGAGTQQLEEELCARFDLESGSTLLRLDSDSMRKADDYFGALASFARGEARVMLGTQMVAKGLDFPGVRLVGVVDADTSLAIADFRALERTYQLVTQVAGRAGRGDMPGRVIVQTWSPECDAIVCAQRGDYEAFARAELATRREAHLPPARRMAMIVVRDQDPGKAEEDAGALAARLRDAGSGRVEVVGPMACPIPRIADFYRFSVELTARRARDIQDAMRALRQAGLLKSDARTAVDVDPVSML